MKYIFLDVDGVLNCMSTESRINGCIGLEDYSLEALKYIVNATEAEIVLSSSWKSSWEADNFDEDCLAGLLNTSLAKYGLKIIDTTKRYEPNSVKRGTGIINFLKEHPADTWAVLDDESFPDYDETGCTEHLIKTSFHKRGLTYDNVEQSIKLLNEGINKVPNKDALTFTEKDIEMLRKPLPKYPCDTNCYGACDKCDKYDMWKKITDVYKDAGLYDYAMTIQKYKDIALKIKKLESQRSILSCIVHKEVFEIMEDE